MMQSQYKISHIVKILIISPTLTNTLFSIYKELVAHIGPQSCVLQGIIVHLELCSPLSTSVLWGHGVDTVDWKLKESASHALMAGTA